MNATMKQNYDDINCVYMSSTLIFMLEQIKIRKPELTIEQALVIVSEIVSHNFPRCLDKYLKGDEWKL